MSKLNADITDMESTNVILVLGGAFNPVHTQHVEIMRIAKEHLEKSSDLKVVEGYLAPATDSYLRSKIKNDIQIKSKHRINMCNLAIHKYDWLKPVQKCYGSAFECGTNVRTNPDHQIVIVIGADRAFTREAPKWRRSFKNSLITIIVGRKGESENVKEAWESDLRNNKIINKEKYFFVDNVDTRENISSTNVRKAIQFLRDQNDKLTESDQQEINDLIKKGVLDSSVADYLVQNRNDLYL